MVRFESKPRKVPRMTCPQQYWCRKQFYALNCQIVANYKHLICDIDCDWPGRTHDSRVWNRSSVKRYLERQRQYLIAGDSAYPISDILMKPYPTDQAERNRWKRLFNRRLCGLRSEMTECTFGIWKRRFPCVSSANFHEFSAKILQFFHFISGTAIPFI